MIISYAGVPVKISSPIEDRCIECGDPVDIGFCGWGEEKPSLCRHHGLLSWGFHISRCNSHLGKHWCARPKDHDPPHRRYPIAWN